MSFGLICYLNVGYPSMEDSIRYARMYANSGCRHLQVDLPSRDPYLEHDFIRERMAKSLARYQGIPPFMDCIAKMRRMLPDAWLMLMLYENVVEEVGLDRLVAFLRENRIENLSYVGDKRPDLRRALAENGLRVASYIQFHLPQNEIDQAMASDAMVLLQACSVGKTRPGCHSFADNLRLLRAMGLKNPVYASVGIKTPNDIARVRADGADGAFIGSSLMNALPNEERLQQTLTGFLAAAGQATPDKEGATT